MTDNKPQVRSQSQYADYAERESLKEESDNSLAEARTILPGVQTLLGFQTIAVLNQRFDDLHAVEQHVHLLSLLLTMISMVLVMAPVAYHRIASPGVASRHTIDLTSRLLYSAMLSLSVALAVDAYVVSSMVLETPFLSIFFATAVLVFCIAGWFVLPMAARRRNELAGLSRARPALRAEPGISAKQR